MAVFVVPPWTVRSNIPRTIGSHNIQHWGIKNCTKNILASRSKSLACAPAPVHQDVISSTWDIIIVEIKISTRFRMLVTFVVCGASFCMVSCLIQCTWDNSGFSLYGGFTDAVASNYARVVCNESLQFILDSLVKHWAFSLVFDVAMHKGNSYPDVHVRFVIKLDLQNFHLLAIPLYEWHTREAMLNTIMTLLDALAPHW